jgi:hypothetical protein
MKKDEAALVHMFKTVKKKGKDVQRGLSKQNVSEGIEDVSADLTVGRGCTIIPLRST